MCAEEADHTTQVAKSPAESTRRLIDQQLTLVLCMHLGCCLVLLGMACALWVHATRGVSTVPRWKVYYVSDYVRSDC